MEKIRQKTHVGNFDSVTWDKDALKAEVESYCNERTVNWSELAGNYNVKNTNGEISGNGGQIIKECLKSEGVDVNRFKRKRDDTDEREEHIRRKKRRGTGGEITVPTEASPEKLRQMAKEKIQSGEYTIGQRIVPKKVCNL